MNGPSRPGQELRRRAAAGLVLLAALVPGGCAAAEGTERTVPFAWWTTGPMTKVRPTDLPPRTNLEAAPIAIAAARNEFECFQVVLRAEGRPLLRVDVGEVVLTPVTARVDEETPRPTATVYLERFLDLTAPSSVEGGTGEWPDPLVPKVDAYAGERRNAFPFDVEAGRTQPLWIEVYVPLGSASGSYRGALPLTMEGRPKREIPFTLEVWPFELPSTSRLRSSFGFGGIAALKQHRGRYTDDTELRALTRLYATAALRHRLSIHGGSLIPPLPDPETGAIAWDDYDAEVGPFLDGTVIPEGAPLAGARATSTDLRLPSSIAPGGARERCLAAWAGHFRERGWLERLFLYMKDEPVPEDYPEILALGREVRRADPGIPTLLTEVFAAPLAEVVDHWTPPINSLGVRPGDPETCGDVVAQGAYNGSAARRLWWYQSCCSHACEQVGDRASTGWPSYVIDAPAVAHRIMPWLAFTHGIEGELYYNTVEAFGQGSDPWDDLLLHGGNGDGTLFYPGTPARIGGATDVPIESLRLKLIREGYEDYEYLRLLADSGGAADAERIARALAPAPYRWELRPGELEEARRTLARAIVAHAGPARLVARPGSRAPAPRGLADADAAKKGTP